MYKILKLNNFRQFNNMDIFLGRRLTVVAGRNSTGKSTILGILANSGELKKKDGTTYTERQFRAEFSEIFHGSKKYDASGSDRIQIDIVDENDNLLDYRKFRTAWQNDNGKDRFRVIPSKTLEDGKKTEAKMQIPVIYLGLSRLFPIGEANEDKITANSINFIEKCENVQNRINIVEFDNIEKMTSQLTTELMAGKGPDIITSAELSLLSSSTEKLIKQGVFANIDDIISNSEDKDKLKLSDYNSNILDAGVYDGKRYFIPVTFEPQILLSSSSKLSKYLDNEQPDLTYGNIKELSGNINNDDNNQALFSSVEDYKNVFLNLINENVDLYSQEYDFDSDDFRKSVTSLKELYSSNEKNEDNIVPMLSSNGQIELFALYDEIADIENDNDEPIILNTPNKDGESTGVITDAIFISNNSDNKEKALEFIEYALSEKVQSDFCGANIEEYLPTTSYGSGWEYPVNNESYSKLFDKAKEVKYINNTANISEANFMYAKDYVDNIKSYRLYGLYNYYNTEVIGDIVDKFLSDEIDENKFLKELKSRTEIYLDE